MTTHALKTWPAPFAAVLAGTKTHEIRVADRTYAVGDVLLLCEWEPSVDGRHPRGYTGRECRVEVTYLTPGGEWGLPANLCVMSIRKVETRSEDVNLYALQVLHERTSREVAKLISDGYLYHSEDRQLEVDALATAIELLSKHDERAKAADEHREVLRGLLADELDDLLHIEHAVSAGRSLPATLAKARAQVAALRAVLGDAVPRQTPEQIGPHEMVGDYDCERCGESMQHYLHTDREQEGATT